MDFFFQKVIQVKVQPSNKGDRIPINQSLFIVQLQRLTKVKKKKKTPRDHRGNKDTPGLRTLI